MVTSCTHELENKSCPLPIVFIIGVGAQLKFLCASVRVSTAECYITFSAPTDYARKSRQLRNALNCSNRAVSTTSYTLIEHSTSIQYNCLLLNDTVLK